MGMKKRLDQWLVDKGLAPSKTKAQEMIEAGQVTLIDARTALRSQAKKPAQSVDENKHEVQIAQQNILKYVSRAGFKLEGALKRTKLQVKGLEVLDVGQSTGGFTDCLLQNGAKHVTGLDVATDELAESLRHHPQVTSLTGINAKNLSQKTPAGLKNKVFDLVVIDVSFISIEKILPQVLPFLRRHGHVLSLIKPQFEVGAKNLNKSGLVKSPAAVTELQEKITELAKNLALNNIEYFAAEMKGRDGNQEYFLYAQKK